jgi:hypothetical protein
MPETQFVLDENGFLVPPAFGGTAAPAFEPRRPDAAQWHPAERQSAQHPAQHHPAPAVRRTSPAVTPRAVAPRAVAGRLNWILGVLGIVSGLASFVWPLLCLTVLVSLALSAVALSRANRLRRRGATGRGLAILALVIGLASAANLVFGFTQLFELQSQLGHLLP